MPSKDNPFSKKAKRKREANKVFKKAQAESNRLNLQAIAKKLGFGKKK
jgi:hypothetical protein